MPTQPDRLPTPSELFSSDVPVYSPAMQLPDHEHLLDDTFLDQSETPVIGFQRAHAAWISPTHTHHRRLQLMYAISGVMHVVTPSGRWILPPGRALLIPNGIEHGLATHKALEVYYIYIRSDLEGVPVLRDCAVISVSPLLRELISACASFPLAYPSDSAENRLIRVLFDQLHLMPHNPVGIVDPKDPRALRIAELIHADISDRRPLSTLAPLAGASPRTIERLFADETGMSFGAWRNRLRLIAALELLAEGQSVTSIALALGYENPSSFIAAFRNTFGTSPARYFGNQLL